LAVDHAVDRGEVAVPLDPPLAGSGGARLLRRAQHAIGRARMGGEPAGRRIRAVAAGAAAHQLVVAPELVEEARHRGRVVAGPGQIANAELVRLELLIARVAGEI